MSSSKNKYSSQLGAILTMVGVAVGLGNVWRFPYMMGNYGGSAFLLLYLGFTLVLAFPALLTEMALGKKTGEGTLTAYESLFGNRFGKALGYLFVGVVTIAGSYYAVVVANVFFSTGFSIVKGFSNSTTAQHQELLGNSTLQYGITLLLIVISLFVIDKGLKKGIERISKIIMPFFLLVILYLIIHAWLLPDALTNVKQFLTPNFDAIGSTEVFAALGQAFFSIGLGGTFVIVYSAFIEKEKDIPRIAILTSLGDLGSSLLVSLFLVPSILVLGMQMNAGPSLIFNTLPELFSTLPAGRWIGSLFLIALSLVAFLSLIAAFQVPIISVVRNKIPTRKLLIAFGILQAILAMPSAFYPEIIGVLDLIFGSGMQVFGSMLAVIGMWWGSKKGNYTKLLFKNKSNGFTNAIVFWLRWIVPGTLLVVLIGYIYNSIT
ncbi:sodium-dependent transporter [Winogradskyella immobilis]|uniref:Sodium-dependent transporter n=1 Tax=Winogradskyella immobilis TaxID=2816852 RepID=A0ABS8EP45_9FLAO|nr:sodium-dependent transporter [Winogradskyella immobilis]MCC1484988.1 sodium-dependent transporter [Winogradskyella immobilis]MCG0017080.1 sodium-dependent transporter [Winogradskyella immobilis]